MRRGQGDQGDEPDVERQAARADANADSVVNALDLQIVIANFGKTVP